MAKITINGEEHDVQDGLTVLQACQSVGVEVPHFCFHERLSIAGNCRMCLVTIEGGRKPVASCAEPVRDGLKISTDDAETVKARNGVMEFLLINHPLDCPICDQGGECDLQDQAMAYGFDRSRYHENKRAVHDKHMGPLVKTIMTRCIHCTRCIRFATEVAGIEELGALYRGEHMEITTYLEKSLTSELSGNVIDLCPVGALTSKPYAFTARSWEIKKTESVDVMDAVGSNIRVDSRGAEVMRILPRLNDDVNEEWISDKTRFVYDGLKRQRLDRPYVRRDAKLQPATWNEAFDTVAAGLKGLKGDQIAAIAGDLCDVESMYALTGLMSALGSPNLDCRQDGAKIDPSNRAGYLFNSTIGGIEEADAILIVGSNPRREAAVLNARIRKSWVASGLPIGVIGEPVDLTYKTEHLGAGPETLKDLIAGKHSFAEVLDKAERPLIILGQGAIARDDGAAILGLARQAAEKFNAVSEDWNGFCMLHKAAARVGGLDVGFVPGDGGLDVAGILDGAASGDIKAVYLLGADEIDTAKLSGAFVIYQGHHGDKGAQAADVILPGAAYTEKNGLYVNTEGRVQRGFLSIFPPGDAREDWSILRALSAVLGHTLPFDSLAALRDKLIADHPHFDDVNEIAPAAWGDFGTEGDVSPEPFTATIENFYMTDPISRCSEIMAQCTAQAGALNDADRTGTDG